MSLQDGLTLSGIAPYDPWGIQQGVGIFPHGQSSLPGSNKGGGGHSSSPPPPTPGGMSGAPPPGPPPGGTPLPGLGQVTGGTLPNLSAPPTAQQNFNPLYQQFLGGAPPSPSQFQQALNPPPPPQPQPIPKPRPLVQAQAPPAPQRQISPKQGQLYSPPPPRLVQ